MKSSSWRTQLRKGALELVLLLLLEREELYGYELVKRLKAAAEIDTSEGTIYPILSRLRKDGLIRSRWIEPESGVPRKYYRITEAGSAALEEMIDAWRSLSDSIGNLLEKR